MRHVLPVLVVVDADLAELADHDVDVARARGHGNHLYNGLASRVNSFTFNHPPILSESFFNKNFL